MNNYTVVIHLFGMGQTVEAAIRYHHKNITIPRSDMEELIKEFNRLNDYKVPKLGQQFKIPVNDELLNENT